MTTVIDNYRASAQAFYQSQAAVDYRAKVPCDGCTACCQHELLFLHPELGDKPEDYLTQDIVDDNGNVQKILQHKPNGDCIYLDRKTGCTIHERSPAICQEFDCRRLFLAFHLDFDRAKRRRITSKDGALDKRVLDAGRARIKTLPSWLRTVSKVARTREGRSLANVKLGNLFK